MFKVTVLAPSTSGLVCNTIVPLPSWLFIGEFAYNVFV